jgi:hypothetical protein
MLSKVFEWSRVTNAAPDDDLVKKRQAVVQGLADELPKNLPLMIDCACAAAAGVTPRFEQGADLILAVVGAIRDQQPAFPESLSENALDVRVVCALVVGEIADRDSKANGAPSAVSQLTSAIVLASLASKPLPAERYLHALVSDLANVCATALNRAADYRRRRINLERSVEAINEANDVPTFWKGAKPKLLQLVRGISANEDIDREELDTLWWAFNGVLQKTEEIFADIPIATAALRAGVELADTVLTPPLPNTRFLLRRVLSTGRVTADLVQRPLRGLISEWDKVASADLVPDNPKTVELVRANPAILPLSWLCLRIAETDSNSLSDFKKATGWDPATKTTPATLAFQAFNERIAQRIHKDNIAG